MVDEVRTTPRKRSSKQRLRYFYLDDKLHKVIYVSRPSDFVETWCYTDRQKMTFAWSHIRRTAEGAWTTKEVGAMVNRQRVQMQRYLASNAFPRPQMTYTLDGKFKNFKYLWSEKDIFRLHDYMRTIHFGTPRKDGHITTLPMPSRAELRAMLKRDAVDYYVVNKDGEMVRAWKEQDW